jgi:hypothetical protein
MTQCVRTHKPNQVHARSKEVPVHELVRLRAGVAELVIIDPVYAPIFERLDQEVATRQLADPIARARAIAAVHNAKD